MFPKPLSESNTPFAESATSATSLNISFNFASILIPDAVCIALRIVLKLNEPSALPKPSNTGFMPFHIAVRPEPIMPKALSNFRLPI